MELRNRERDATPFVTKDGSTIREYLHTGLQSLAEASLDARASTQRHYHARSEEIYLILEGGGELEVDGERRAGRPGRRRAHSAAGLARAHRRRGRCPHPLLLRPALRRRRHVLRVAAARIPRAAGSTTLGLMAATPISFARGAPAPELIPADELADCAHDVARKDGARVFAYGPGSGYAPLREWIAERHGVAVRASRPHRRGAAGIRLLRRRAARTSTGARPRRGSELRPPTQGARARGGRDRGPADGRRGPRP